MTAPSCSSHTTKSVAMVTARKIISRNDCRVFRRKTVKKALIMYGNYMVERGGGGVGKSCKGPVPVACKTEGFMVVTVRQFVL